MAEHTRTLDELAQDDPELKNYLTTTRMRMLSGMEWDNLFLTEQEAPRCPYCERPNDGTVAIRRENTAYCDDVNNWLISCRECFDYRDECWAEQWEDYSMAL
jgi:hypothetical protein